jgi:Xaa-Pro dipeptidase
VQKGDPTITPEWKIKQHKVKNFLKNMGLEAFVFSRRSSFSWLTDGAESGVDEFSELGVADLVLTEDRSYVVAPNNEIELLTSEALEGQGYEPVVYSWKEDRFAALQAFLGGRKAGSDIPVPGCKDFYREVKELRYSLLPGELAKMSTLGQTTAALVGGVCKSIRPGDSEVMIAGEIKGRLGREGIYAPVVLVAADERLHQFRHPIPTKKRVEKKAMVVVCARRSGLTVALTRMVCVGSAPAQTVKRLELVNTISAGMIAVTCPGTAVSDIFLEAVKAYKAVDYDGEWEKHHQGGPIGYENRDYLASPECPGVVLENQAFAWNPMIVDVKSEETIIASADGFKKVTYDPEWPYLAYQIENQFISLPDILII